MPRAACERFKSRNLIVDRSQVSAFPTLILIGSDARIIETRSSVLRGPKLAATLDAVLPQ